MLKLLVLTTGCVHNHLEDACANLNNQGSTILNYNDACHVCDGSLSNKVHAPRFDGMCSFLSSIFITKEYVVKDNSSNDVVNALHKLPHVGKKIFNLPRSNTPPELKFIKLTISQMTATGIP